MDGLAGLDLSRIPFNGNNGPAQDLVGNIIALGDISARIPSSYRALEPLADTQLTFADEKKELVYEESICGSFAGRLALILYLILLLLVTGVAYSRGEHYQRPELSQVWVAAFFAS